MRKSWISDREHGIPFFEEFELPYLYEHWPEDALPHRQPARPYLIEADGRVGPWPDQGDRLFEMPHEYPVGKTYSDDWRYPPW